MTTPITPATREGFHAALNTYLTEFVKRDEEYAPTYATVLDWLLDLLQQESHLLTEVTISDLRLKLAVADLDIQQLKATIENLKGELTSHQGRFLKIARIAEGYEE
jgi:hypothetical protein